jgi:hypothetical protein
MSKLKGLLTLMIAAGGLAVLAPGAAASGSPQGPPAGPTTPPFTQCPAIGLDTSCEFLVDVTNANPASNPIVLRDSSQSFYDGGDDVTVAVQNDSSAPLGSIHLGIKGSEANSFGFDGDGLCNPPTGPSPEGCPFGPPGNNESPYDYYGPDAEFVIDAETTDSGTVVFPTPLQPGQYTYFALEANPFGGVYVVGGTANDVIGSTLTDPTGAEAVPPILPGPSITVPAPVNVTDQASIKGANGASAEGTVIYRVYSDPGCTKEVFKSEVEIKTPGAVPPSEPFGAAEPTNANYYWVVEYSGNEGEHPNSKNTSFCGNEVVTFGTPPSTGAAVSTTLVASNGTSGSQITVAPGIAVHDTAVVTLNGQPLSGRVTYYVYSDSACTQQIKTANLGGGVASGGAFPASASVTLPLGTYYFQVAYSGGGGVAGSRSACGAEVLNVATPPPPPPSSQFTPVGNPQLNPKTGQLVVVGQFPSAGTATATGVVQQGATLARVETVASAAKHHGSHGCKHGYVKKGKRCVNNAPVSYGTTVMHIPGAGTYSIVITPTPAVMKALKAGKRLHVVVSTTFQNSAGGTPVTHVQNVTAALPKPKKHKHHHR